MRNTEIKVLDLLKGDGIVISVRRDGERGINKILLKTDEIQPVIRSLVAKLKGQEIIEGELYAYSGYAANNKRPFVELSHGLSWSIQVSPHEAREYAALILEAADAAESDGFIAEFFKDAFKGDEQKVYALLNDFRAFREREREKHSAEKQ